MALNQLQTLPNWQGLLMCWAIASGIFWWMGGFQPVIPAGPPARLRRKLTVSCYPP